LRVIRGVVLKEEQIPASQCDAGLLDAAPGDGQAITDRHFAKANVGCIIDLAFGDTVAVTHGSVICLCRKQTFPRGAVCQHSRDVYPATVTRCSALLADTERVEVALSHADNLAAKTAVDG